MDKKFFISIEYAVIVLLVKVIFSFFLGSENAVIGLLFTLGGILFLNRDFTEKGLFRFFSFSILNVLLVFIVTIASLNNYVGFVINIVVIFFTIYFYMNDFRQATSLIFVMVYVYMYISPISFNLIPKRILAVLFGVGIMILLQFIYNKNKFKKESDKSIIRIIQKLDEQIESILNNTYKLERSIEISNEIRTLILNIEDRNGYILKLRRKEITKLNIGFCLCRLNLIVSRGALNENHNSEKIVKKYYSELHKQLNNIKNFNNGKMPFEELKIKLEKFNKEMEVINTNIEIIDETIYALAVFVESLGDSSEYKESVLQKIYMNVNTPAASSFIEGFVEDFNIKSLRFRFSLKYALSVSVAIFALSFFKVEHSAWIILSICSVLQPYLEDSMVKGGKRIIGVIIGVVIYILIFKIMKIQISADIVFIVGITGFFAFTDYMFRFAMMSIFSISMACSGIQNISQISFERFALVIIGTLIALAFDEFFLPYKINDAMNILEKKYKILTDKILGEMDKMKYDDDAIDKVLDLSIKRKRIENKLINESKKLNSEECDKFIFLQNMDLSKGKSIFLKYYYLKLFSKKNKLM